MNFPSDLHYTKDHEWIRVQDGVGTVGITEHAQGELGDIVYIDIPDSAGEVAVHEVFGTIEAVKTVADLFAPVSGTIVEVNRALNDAPETVNQDCYGDGWLVKIKLANPADFDSLLDADAYKQLVGQ